MSSITMRNLAKNYGSTPVLRGIDIDIRDGEFVAWSGPRAAASRRCCA
jgi:multiple sugar transport system ATP-binding protein